MKAVRYLTLFLIIGLVAALIIWAYSTGLTMNYWFILMSPLIALLLLALWYAPFGWGGMKTRLTVSGLLFFFLALVTCGFIGLTRYEGSTSGSSMPKFAWKWDEQPDPDAEIEASVNTDLVDDSIEGEAARVASNFLGPNSDGMWPEAAFNLDWSANPPEELWRRPIGVGWSSFAIANGKAITIEQVDADETTTCVNLLTGETLWTHADVGIDFVESMADKPTAIMGGEGPRATPTIHGDKVYIMGSIGNAKCLNFADGSLVWKRDIITEEGGVIPKWGKSSSPVVIEKEGLVLLTGSETSNGATLIACDLETGETKWKYEGNGASYSTPRLLNIHGTLQIVSVNQNDITGVNPATGKLLWLHEWKGNFPKVGQPHLLSDNRILCTASYGVGSPLIKIQKNDDSWSAEQVWKSKWMKTKFSSAVVLGEHAYGIDESRLFAMDLEKGGKTWKGEKVGFGQNLLFGDHLLVQMEEGPVLWGTISPEGFTEKNRLEAMSAMTWNAPVVAGRFLLVRNDREAVCFVLPKK